MSPDPLPVELLTTLGGFCDYAQLVSLARANHTFHAIFNPILYKLNAADVPRKSCLHWAVEHDLISTIKMAVAYGADINNTGAENESYVLRLSGDDDDEDDNVYASPLHLAVLKKRPEMVRWLLDNKARLDVPSYQLCSCHTSYDPILWYPLHFAISHSSDEILWLLLERGARCSSKNVVGLHCAVKSGALSAVEFLTQLDSFDPDYRDLSYMTPLHWVYGCKNIETAVAITWRLVQRGVPVNMQDRIGRTALDFLVALEMLEPAIILLQHGADPTLSDVDNLGLHRLSCCFHETRERKIQIAWETDPRKAEAMSDTRLEFAKFIIKSGVDVNGILTHEAAPFLRPLFWALAATRDARCVQLVLDAGADIRSAVVETYHTASESLLRFFFDGFDENKESDERIWMPFDTDLRKYRESVCLLLEKGARIDAVGDEYSALSKACELERKKGALTLLVDNATCRNTELGHVGKLRERYKADEVIFRLLDGFYCQLEVEMKMREQHAVSQVV